MQQTELCGKLLQEFPKLHC